jgi:hypothetical protein
LIPTFLCTTAGFGRAGDLQVPGPGGHRDHAHGSIWPTCPTRVAISEHVYLQSGLSIWLLVLDEVLGPLDEDRKARMLLAQERLRGRFRHILVVTHDANIKEQLLNAIEVVKLPGRRATARPMSG